MARRIRITPSHRVNQAWNAKPPLELSPNSWGGVLELPASSHDLLIPQQYVLKAVGIYEVLRRFNRHIRLTPFRLEDFCAAIASKEQSSLLFEMHVTLLRKLLQNDELQGVHFGVSDLKDSFNLLLHLIDPMTWPEVLRSYLESHKPFDKASLDILNAKDYPFVSVADRLTVLEFLTNQLTATDAVRDDLEREEPGDDFCTGCGESGELVLCDTCPAAFHSACAEPAVSSDPNEGYECALCDQDNVAGVQECSSELERQGLLQRHDPLGFDRHQRIYWFVSRRIFIEDERGNGWYYSTVAELKQLMAKLDNDEEKELCSNLATMSAKIERQMGITEAIAKQFNGFDANNNRQFKLREEGTFKSYVNHYAAENDGKKGTLAVKFSLNNFEWDGTVNGSQEDMLATLRKGLVALEQLIPLPFMLENWVRQREMWLEAVARCRRPKEFAEQLVKLQQHSKACIYNEVWHQQFGHLKLQRTTPEERQKDIELSKKKEDDEKSWYWHSIGRRQHSNGNQMGQRIEPVDTMTTFTLHGVTMPWMPPLTINDTLDVSDALAAKERFFYPHKAKKCSVDDLLSQRTSEAMATEASGADAEATQPNIEQKWSEGSRFVAPNGRQSLMVLPKNVLKKLARTGGQGKVTAFQPSKLTAAWPYPCARPSFSKCWQFRTMAGRSLAAMALELRIIWCCFRWDEMNEDAPSEVQEYDNGVLSVKITAKRIHGECVQYLRETRFRRHVPASGRSGLRECNGNFDFSDWVDENELKLWQIKEFAQR